MEKIGPARGREAGAALATAVFVLVIVAVVAAAALQTSSDTLRSGRSFRESALALWAADAGMSYTLGTWPATTVGALNAGDSVNFGWDTLSNGATYRASIHRVDTGASLRTYVVRVEGRGAGTGESAGQRTIIRVVNAAALYRYGVFSRQGITVNGNAASTVVSDSYNSADGAYNAATADSLGGFAANGNIDTSGKILGDVTAGGTVNLGGGSATGTVTSSATDLPSYGNATCPVSYTPTSQMPAGLGTSYNYSAITGALTVNGNNNITFGSSPTQFYFSSITLTGSSMLTVNSGGAHIDMYVSGAVALGGNGLVNTSGKASTLSIFGCGTDNSNWSVKGGSQVAFALYAPNHPVDLVGGSDFYGAIVGNGVTASGGTHVHYDESLRNTPDGTYPILDGTWAELSTF